MIHSQQPSIALIIGARRSGTTLLRTVLNGHPDLRVHPDEPQFIRALWRQYGDPIWNVPAAVQTVCRDRLCPPEITCEALHAALGPPPLAVRDVVDAYLHLWAGSQLGLQQLILKDPYFTFHIDRLEALFPGARYLDIVRDPRANIASQRARWRDASLTECARWWTDAVAVGRHLHATRPARYCQIRFEDLVIAPEATLATICHFLGVPYCNDLLTFDLDTTGYTADGRAVRERFTEFDPSRLTRWQQQLPPHDVALIERLCGAQMTALGYELLKPTVDPVVLAVRERRERWAYGVLRAGRRVKNGARAVRRAARQVLRR